MDVVIDRSIVEARDRLIDHPLYEAIDGIDDVRVFMSHHVFAVWDFFSLLKRLQREVTCVEVPWAARGRSGHGRFIMEIVLGEETDEDVDGGHVSHFELYLRAMDEIGADRSAIDAVVALVADGVAPSEALVRAGAPDSVRAFVGHTMGLAIDGAPHEVAASFCHGRENLLPDVLGTLQAQVGAQLGSAPTFAHYLQRHIELDHDEHGPLALRLLDALCDGDPVRNAEADRAGVAAIEARIALWDGILAALPSNAGDASDAGA